MIQFSVMGWNKIKSNKEQVALYLNLYPRSNLPSSVTIARKFHISELIVRMMPEYKAALKRFGLEKKYTRQQKN